MSQLIYLIHNVGEEGVRHLGSEPANPHPLCSFLAECAVVTWVALPSVGTRARAWCHPFPSVGGAGGGRGGERHRSAGVVWSHLGRMSRQATAQVRWSSVAQLAGGRAGSSGDSARGLWSSAPGSQGAEQRPWGDSQRKFRERKGCLLS